MGRGFLNSCKLYMGLVPDQFVDDRTKIHWVLSYMKEGRASQFADRMIWLEQKNGTLSRHSWSEFCKNFVMEFCPRNEVQAARMHLEGSRYHQGSRSVDDYIDGFTNLVERAEYTELANIVLKFRHGLHPDTQKQIATLVTGWPADDNPKEWYHVLRK